MFDQGEELWGAFGWKVFAGMGVAWQAAMGGVAVAQDYALGGYPLAANANNAAANQYMRSQLFFRWSETAAEYMGWLNLLWILPLLKWRRMIRKHRRPRQSATKLGPI